MSAKTNIEWTGRTWNPLAAFLKRAVEVRDKHGKIRLIPAGTRGWFCTKCSPGCAHCYAEKINLRLGNGLEYALRNLDEIEFRLVNLDAPLRWKKPQTVFVNSMTDLFHEAVPRELIDKVFAVMAVAPLHTFQVLTKRAEGMQRYFDDDEIEGRVSEIIFSEINPDAHRRYPFLFDVDRDEEGHVDNITLELPLRNVWLGVSVENQKAANDRIGFLLETPAAVRFLSCEPLLGPVNLNGLYHTNQCEGVNYSALNRGLVIRNKVDWLICGGESGVGARPMHPDWARGLRDQCVAADVPFFFKQFGEFVPCERWHPGSVNLGDCSMLNVGKKAAGRLLDGREWNEMAEVKR